MKIDERIIRNHLHDMAREQLIMEYAADGWEIAKDKMLEGHQADLIIAKGDKAIVFDIKSSKYSAEQRIKATRLSKEAQKKGYEFRLVLVNPPKERSVEVIGLEMLFHSYFSENFPYELDELSSRTMLNDVYDCDVDEITVNEGKDIAVKGSGIIDVLLEYGGSDDDYSTSNSFPFFFEATLRIEDGKLILEEVSALTIDTSSF